MSTGNLRPLALGVPFSRFTSRVGGGATFYFDDITRMILSPRLLPIVTSFLILVGCTGAPKPVSHKVPAKRPYWEYAYLDGWGSDKSPEADKLRQAGWVFVGYNRGYGGTIAIDEKSEVAKQMAICKQMNNVKGPRDDMLATFIETRIIQ